MDIEQSAYSRRELLDRAVQTTIQKAFETFSDPSQLPGLEAYCDTTAGERERIHSTLQNIHEAVERCVLAHVRDWVRERGLEEVFEILDRHSVGKIAERLQGGLTVPDVMSPGISLAKVQLECKRRVLGELKTELEERKRAIEGIQREIRENAQRVQRLSEEIGWK